MKKTRHLKRDGRCYELSASYVIKNEEFELVHGKVKGKTGLVLHAWVEVDNTVYDLVLNKIFPKEYYKRYFRATESRRYSHKEICDMVVEYGHCGPFE